ncbi:MAG: KH domain-containing protein [Clostridia bacterium]|nr:KH domain-containing protein [Clostridia bacterium]
MKKVLEDMARAIVDNPDSVSVTEETNEDETVFTLHVAEGDMGMIIGKHGKIARALRTVTKAAAKIADRKITVEIK